MRQSGSQQFFQILTAANFLKRLIRAHRIQVMPKLAVILGSGWTDFTNVLDVAARTPYSAIPHFTRLSVAGHPGSFVLARIQKQYAIYLEGRLHYYEGHSMNRVTDAVRVLGKMGIKHLIVTNAAGGINPQFKPGELMLISDHISSFIPNPLVGPNEARFGTRFPDMSECYSIRLRKLALRCAKETKIRLREGRYVAVTGPSYETTAEIRMLRQLGGDAVGMSTVPEIIVARHMGIECLGISLVTNAAAGISKRRLSHTEVLATARLHRLRSFKFLKLLCHEILERD